MPETHIKYLITTAINKKREKKEKSENITTICKLFLFTILLTLTKTLKDKYYQL